MGDPPPARYGDCRLSYITQFGRGSRIHGAKLPRSQRRPALARNRVVTLPMRRLKCNVTVSQQVAYGAMGTSVPRGPRMDLCRRDLDDTTKRHLKTPDKQPLPREHDEACVAVGRPVRMCGRADVGGCKIWPTPTSPDPMRGRTTANAI